MANNREAKVRFSADTKEFRQGVSSANQSLKELQASLKLNSAELAGASDKSQAYIQRQSLLSQEIDVQQSKINNLNAQLEVATRLYGSNSTEVSRLRVQISNATTAQVKMFNDLDNVNSSLALLSSQSSDANSSLGRLETTISSQEAELLDLKRAYTNVVIEQGDSSDEARQLESQLSRLDSELSNNRQILRSAESAADRFGNTLDDAGDVAEDSADGYSSLKDVVSDLASDAIDSAVDAFKELAIEGDRALNKLKGSTGASSKQLKDYEQVMKNVFSANFGDSLDDVAVAVSEVVRQMGKLDGKSVESITKNAFVLSDTFDMDVKESVRAVNSMMNQFGLDSDSAFNLIVQGAQNGLNANDDLLDVVNEYSVQFANAGFSADDMFNMLINGADTGTWSVDKLGDAVKEMNIRFSDGSVVDALNENRKVLGLSKQEVQGLQSEYNKGGDSAKLAVGKMIDSILSVEDETERYKLGVSVFGTMWEDLGADTINSLMSTQGELSSTKDSVSDLSTSIYSDLGSKFDEIGRKVKVCIVQPVVDSLLPAFESVFDFVSDNWSGLAPVFASLGGAIGALSAIIGFDFAKNLVIATANMVGLNLAMLANPITWIIVGITAVVAAFVYFWNTSDSFRGFWIDLWYSIKSIFEPVISVLKDSLSNAFVSLKVLWDQLTSSFGVIFSSLEPLKSLFEIIAGVIGGIVVSAISILIGALSGIFGALSGIIDVVSGVIQIFTGLASITFSSLSAIWESIVAIFTGNFDKIGSIWADWASNMGAIVSNIWEGIKNVFNGAIGAISGFVSGFVDGVIAFFEGLYDTLVGHSIVPDLLNKIKDFFLWLPNQIVNIVKSFVDGVVSLFSSLMSKASSIFNAVKSFMSSVWNAIKSTVVNVASSLFSSVCSKFNSMKSSISSIFNSVKSSVSSIWNGIRSSISNVLSSVYNSVSSKFSNIKSSISDKLLGAKSVVVSIFDSIKSKISNSINSARDAVKSAIDKIKGFFNFSPKLPKLKVPHFSISPSGWKVDDLLKGSIPHLSVSWYADGGIFKSPTIFNTRSGLKGVGEAGPEAIIPLDRLQSFIDNSIAKLDFNDLILAINNLASRNIELSINGLSVATAVASDSDFVNGNRLNLKERGLAL